MKFLKNALLVSLSVITLSSAKTEAEDAFHNLKTKISSTAVKALDTFGEKMVTLDLMYNKNHIILNESLGTNRLIVVEGHLKDHTMKLFSYNKDRYELAKKMWSESKDAFYTLLPKLGDHKRIIIQLGTNSGDNILQFGSTIKISIDKDWINETHDEHMFTLAHEISHYLLGHLKNDSKKAIARKISLDAYYAASQAQEKEADLNAAQILGTAQGGITCFTKCETSKIKRQENLRNQLKAIANIDENTLLALEEKHEKKREEILLPLISKVIQNKTLSLAQKVSKAYSVCELQNELYYMKNLKPTTHPTDRDRVAYLQEWEKNKKLV